MKKIYLYKGTKLIYSVWANSIEDVSLAPLDYYEGDTQDLIISDVEYLHPTVEGKTLREMSRQELVAQGIEISLNEGERVVDKKLITVEQPSKYHRWNGSDWVADIEEVKKAKREELKTVRDGKIHANIEVHGSIFQVRPADTTKFALIGLGLALGEIKADGKENWVLADNTVKEFTNGQLVEVLKAKEKREREIFAKFIELDTRLQALDDISNIEALEWD